MAQDGRGATFEVVPAEPRFETANVAGTAYTRVALPGGLVSESPGRPALPTLTLHVAVPEGMSPRLRVSGEEWVDRAAAPPLPVVRQRFVSDDPRTGPVSEFTTEPDPAVYRGGALYPAAAAELGGGAMVGEWWVAPIHVHPVRWDPRAGSYRVLRKMTVRVDFVAATDRELSVRPATRPGAQARAWDRVQRGLVKNYEAARAFPARPRAGALGALPRAGSLGRARLAVNPEWRLSVAQTGWTSVSYATLAGAGFPTGIAIANVRVEERGYDDVGDSATATAIPVVTRDGNTNGVFDVGDAITFHARSLRDRYGTGNIELRYASDNVYWLTWGSTPAPVPGTVSGTIGGAATIPNSFREVIRLEENHAAMMAPTWNATSPPEAIEYLFWTDGLDGDQFQTQIPFVDPDPTQPFRIRARYQGRLTGFHRVNTFFDGASGTDTLSFNDEFSDPFPGVQPIYLLDTGFTIPGSHIGGPMRYRHIGLSRPNLGVPPSDPSKALLDVIEATYNRLYKARSNVLRFTSGGSGGVFEIHVDGFTASAIEVHDVTDPLSPLRIPDASVSGTGPYTVQFRTDATSGERRFIAFVPGSETALSGPSVVADAASDLRSPGAYDPSKEARSILITPEPFFNEADRLAGIRRNQGYVVEVARIQDVYDEFNGGIKSPRAIRRYIRHGYLSWTPRPTHVVLAGDGSLDYRHDIESSGIDWIPTYMRFEPIAGSLGPEQVGQDPYYYAMGLATPEPGGGSFVPNVSLTRIPASSEQELATYIDKVIAYENFGPSDSWRGRQFLFADDQYSVGINAVQPYCLQGSEFEFEDATRDFANITTQSPGGAGIQNDFLDMDTYTDPVPAVGGCKSLANVTAQLSLPGGGYDQLRSEMTQGSLIVNMQTHGNRYVIAHEYMMCNSPVFCTGPNDPSTIQNVGKPFYLMVWGCHTNQFPDYGVYTVRNAITGPVDSLDALGEQFLFMPNRGSIASLGSTSLEFLQTNHFYSNRVADAFYTTPPTPPPPPGEPQQARWILGEVMLHAQIVNGMSGSPASIMTRTVHLFADPMLRMDALPPRVAQVTVGGTPFLDSAPLTSDSPTDSSALVAELRDEVGIDSLYLTEQDVASGAVTPVDTLTYSVAYSDSSRVATLTANVRPRVGNYDLQIRAVDVNGRPRLFTLQIRTPIRYLADGVEIVNNVFVQSGAVLRAEVTSPIPLTADSLELRLDGGAVATTKTQLDTAGRVWALQTAPGVLTTGTHTIQVAIGGRTTGFDQRTFQTTSEFTIRGVAVVDPRMQGTGCGGSIFQYELSAAARKVELLLMTVAGRRVASIELPRQAGFNVYCWNGRDSQAHETAQGVYFYRLRATDSNGKTVNRDGRMIRVR